MAAGGHDLSWGELWQAASGLSSLTVVIAARGHPSLCDYCHINFVVRVWRTDIAVAIPS